MTVTDLRDYGMVRMDEGEIQDFLSSQRVGVLGLPGERAPSMRPMSFGFDGESRLYMLYVLASESRKEQLTRQAKVAQFLVYSAETAFNWRSVLLTGELAEVPEEDQEAVEERLTMVWRPDLFQTAAETTETKLYEFQIEEQSGLKHAGLPPGLQETTDGVR